VGNSCGIVCPIDSRFWGSQPIAALRVTWKIGERERASGEPALIGWDRRIAETRAFRSWLGQRLGVTDLGELSRRARGRGAVRRKFRRELREALRKKRLAWSRQGVRFTLRVPDEAEAGLEPSSCAMEPGWFEAYHESPNAPRRGRPPELAGKASDGSGRRIRKALGDVEELVQVLHRVSFSTDQEIARHGEQCRWSPWLTLAAHEWLEDKREHARLRQQAVAAERRRHLADEDLRRARWRQRGTAREKERVAETKRASQVARRALRGSGQGIEYRLLAIMLGAVDAQIAPLARRLWEIARHREVRHGRRRRTDHGSGPRVRFVVVESRATSGMKTYPC